MKFFNSYSRILSLVALLLGMALATSASDKPKKVKYVAPAGFDGHSWGALLISPGFARLPLKPIGVGAAWMRPVQKELIFTCVPMRASSAALGGSADGCDIQATMNTLSRRFEGGGFYVLSEYTIEDQGARYGDGQDSVVLHPVVYQFCANWKDTKREIPPRFDEMNQFCGVRMMFQTETSEELRSLPPDHVTAYDRVLDKLIARFGKPDHFRRRGQVVVETVEGDAGERVERKFRVWRWCPAPDRGLRTRCDASVVLTLEPDTGEASVLYSTPLLWEFAYARQNNGFRGDRLFKVLHARK
jgi:hypothetical protein